VRLVLQPMERLVGLLICAVYIIVFVLQPVTGVIAARPSIKANYGATRLPLPTPLATVHIGYGPTMLAIDARREHVFVYNAGASLGTSLSTIKRRLPSIVSTLDAVTGRLLRTATTGLTPVDIAVDERTDRVFVTNAGPLGVNGIPSGHGNVSALDAATGQMVATVPMTGGFARLAVDDVAGRVYILNDNGVDVLDATTGRVRRHIGGVIGGSIVVDPRTNRAFVSSDGGTVTILDTIKEIVLGSVLASGGARMVAVDTRAARVFYLSGTFRQGDLTALDARTGVDHYDIQVTNGYPSVAAVDEQLGRVYVESNNGPTPTSIAILDSATGRHLHDAPLGQAGFPTGPNDRQSIAVDEAHHQIFVLTVPFTLDHTGAPRHGAARLVTFDARTGVVSSSVGVGKDPQAVVVDTRLRRVYVANRGDNTVSVFDASRL